MRHVIVTGGTRGLGRALVKALLDSGYKVSACGTRISVDLQELAEGSDNLFVSKCRVDNGQEVDEFFHATSEWAGQDELYGLINNAGIAREGILATFPNVDSKKIIETNLLGSLYCARAAIRCMLKNKHGGRIINVSSIIGSRGYVGLGAYSASKAGVDGLTRALAREVGRRKITVNSVAPGYMRTDMSLGLDDEQLDQIIRRTPLGRLATLEDIVPTVLFLLSEGAAMITGQVITVDGGITV